MKQVVQDQGQGTVEVVDVPEPMLRPQGILVDTVASIISSGTERAKIEMGEMSLVAKAKARPDLARKVFDQAKRDGVKATIDLVKDRLGTPQPLGYSAVGVVRRVGSLAKGFEPGQLVAIAGAGYANHAETNYVPANLAASVPPGVAAEQAAFSTLASIALHGIRQAELTQGGSVVVSGLGLIGQLTVRLLKAYGHPVIGVDPSQVARDEVSGQGVEVRNPDDPALLRVAVDAVLLTAATSGDDPVRSAPLWCRDRGRVVVVGDVGLSLVRAPYYDNEIDLRFSRSYGPGRYDSSYEEHGHDYPIGYVRWTEGRNLGEFLRLLSDGRLEVDGLIDARYDFKDAAAAYERLAHGERARAIALEYPGQRESPADPPVSTVPRIVLPHAERERIRVSVCGAGNFARKSLIPAFEATGDVEWAYIATASGLTASHVASQQGFAGAVATNEEALTGDLVDAAIIATRHDSHGHLAAVAAKRELPTYIEKPLALDPDELASIESVAGSRFLTTGFNRRYAPATRGGLGPIRARRSPANVQMRINAGRLPAGHWAGTAEQGGRIVGEVCHFVDLACHLLASPIRRISAASIGESEPQTEDTLQILAKHADNSVTTIAYFANGSSGLPKERVEVHWDGLSFLVDDFRDYWLDGGSGLTRRRSRRQDKGHSTLVQQFVEFARGKAENPVPFHHAAHATRVTFAIVESLRTGDWVELPSITW